MAIKYKEDVINLVVSRLKAMPPNISFAIGDFGDFTRDQLIDQVREQTDVGKATVKLQLEYIKEMPKIAVSISRR